MNVGHKNVFLTGGSGHIGSRWLQEASDQVRKIIALTQKKSESVMLLASPSCGVEVVIGDIETFNLNYLDNDIDIVVHLAALTNPSESTEARAQYEAINHKATKRIGEACVNRDIRLIFSSTSGVYAGQNGSLMSENTDYIAPQNFYAQTKYNAEQALLSLVPQGLRLTILRFGSVFGYAPGMKFHTAINKFVWQAAHLKPLSVWRENMNQLRPYTYAGDCAAAINFVIEQDIFKGEIYNVVSENATVQGIIGILRSLVPKLSVTLTEAALANNLSYGLDDSKIRKLGFLTRGTLQAGIEGSLRRLNSNEANE
jgi:UDP-glucose 4-epimerase